MITPAQVTMPTRLALRIGSSANLVEVASFAEASRLYSELRDRYGRGASSMPKGRIYDAETIELVASLSYNARVWDGDRCLFDPFGAEACS
jgi:hypothetical protein